MSDLQSFTGQMQPRSLRLFFFAGAIGMFLLIAIASCTSSQTFSEIYRLVAEFLSLSKTTLSMSLRNSPGWGHFLCYALLSLFLSGVFSHRARYLGPLIAILFGGLMEAIQSFIPSRDASLLDMLVNVLGIALGYGLYTLVAKYVRSANKAK